MTEQIMKILPKHRTDIEPFNAGYNAGRDDCAAAIEKANLVRCPTEQQIEDVVFENYHSKNNIAKALLALLRGER